GIIPWLQVRVLPGPLGQRGTGRDRGGVERQSSRACGEGRVHHPGIISGRGKRECTAWTLCTAKLGWFAPSERANEVLSERSWARIMEYETTYLCSRLDGRRTAAAAGRAARRRRLHGSALPDPPGQRPRPARLHHRPQPGLCRGHGPLCPPR